MLRKAAARALWLTRGAALFGGAVVTLVLVLRVATTALAAVPGDPFRLGQSNLINAMSTLGGNVDNPMLRITNNSTGANVTALDLRVKPNKKAPMKLNSDALVANLNADTVDGKDSTELVGQQGPQGTARAYARVFPDTFNFSLVHLDPSRTSGFTAVTRPLAGIYCLTPASGIDPNTRPAVVSVDDSSTFAASQLVTAKYRVNGNSPCTSDQFTVEAEVHQYLRTSSGGQLDSFPSNSIAFTIIVP